MYSVKIENLHNLAKACSGAETPAKRKKWEHAGLLLALDLYFPMMSYSDIAKFWGYKDHTTICYIKKRYKGSDELDFRKKIIAEALVKEDENVKAIDCQPVALHNNQLDHAG